MMANKSEPSLILFGAAILNYLGYSIIFMKIDKNIIGVYQTVKSSNTSSSDIHSPICQPIIQSVMENGNFLPDPSRYMPCNPILTQRIFTKRHTHI